jgi:ribosomal protein S12 methylthiotransferase accessory factor
MTPEARRLELVSDRVGLVRSLTPVQRGADEPRPPHVMQATLSHFDFRSAPLRDRLASGKGETEEEAAASALGEAVEHYCAAIPDVAAARRAAFAALGGSAVTPPECVLYAESQYRRPGWPYARFHSEVPIAWTAMRELAGGEAVWAPSSLVYLSWPAAAEEHFCPATSNGLAAGPDLPSAIFAGLCELIERDAFLITWMNRLPAPELEWRGAGGVEESIVRHYARFGIEVRVFALPSDLGVPVMMAIAGDRSGAGPAAVVGLGCHPRPRTALRKALFEVCQVRPGEVQRFRQDGAHARLAAYEDVHTLEDHSAFVSAPQRRGELAFLLDNGRSVRLADLPDGGGVRAEEALVHIGGAIAAAGCRALYADLTTPDVAGCGLKVVRTIVPGLQPMHFGYGEERLGGRRLYELPARLGYRATPAGEADLNPCPHPLA